MTDLTHRRRNLTRLKGEYDLALRRVEEERKALARARQRYATAKDAQALLQAAAESVQKQAHERLAGVVTRCLKAVFGSDAYTFAIEFSRKRGRTEARLVFKKGDLVITDPAEETSIGAVEVAAFALRLSCMMLTKPRVRRLIVADEPWQNLNGEEYQDRMAKLLIVLAKEMGIQIILVSGEEWLSGVGKTIRL